MNWLTDRQSKFLPCNACEQETEHNVNAWDQWECVQCGEVQPPEDEH